MVALRTARSRRGGEAGQLSKVRRTSRAVSLACSPTCLPPPLIRSARPSLSRYGSPLWRPASSLPRPLAIWNRFFILSITLIVFLRSCVSVVLTVHRDRPAVRRTRGAAHRPWRPLSPPLVAFDRARWSAFLTPAGPKWRTPQPLAGLRSPPPSVATAFGRHRPPAVTAFGRHGRRRRRSEAVADAVRLLVDRLLGANQPGLGPFRAPSGATLPQPVQALRGTGVSSLVPREKPHIRFAPVRSVAARRPLSPGAVPDPVIVLTRGLSP